MHAAPIPPSAERPLPFRRRPDLVVRQQRCQGRTRWTVKDPLALKYFHFQPEEYAILAALDGRVSLQQIQTEIERAFAPRKIALETIWQTIHSLHESGLIVSDTPGQGAELKRRADEKRRKSRWQSLTNLLTIRLRGFDPTPILARLSPAVRWMYSGPAIAAGALLGLSAVMLLIVQFDVFQAKLPAFRQFFGPGNAFWLVLSLIFAKVVHELAHGLTCRHFGGKAEEMGLMFLVFVPCLYCNVTDSWMLPRKRDRMAIAAAGMSVELLMASIATWVWWFTGPGLLNFLCLNLMFLCSISTVLFNANPLMRFDGYYILADWLEVPNLAEKGRTVVLRALGRLCLGIDPPADPTMPRRRRILFAIYAVASFVYRWVLVTCIVWLLLSYFEEHRLQALGVLIAAVAVAGFVLAPCRRLVRFFREPGRRQSVSRLRLGLTLGLTAAVIAFLVAVPLPYRVVCPSEVTSGDADAVYVDVPGRLARLHVRPGETVTAGAPIASLVNADLDETLAGLERQRDALRQQVAVLQRRRFASPELGGRLAELRKSLAGVDALMREERQRRSRLVITAPRGGTVFPTAARTAKPTGTDALPEWSGDPLAGENRGCFLRSGEQLCAIGDGGTLDVSIVVDQSDAEFVRVGDVVELKFDHLPAETFRGRITALSREDVKRASTRLSTRNGGELATRPGKAADGDRPLSPSLFARVRIENSGGLLVPGNRGRARIHARRRTLGDRVVSSFLRLVHFR